MKVAILLSSLETHPVLVDGVRSFAGEGSQWLASQVTVRGGTLRADLLSGDTLWAPAEAVMVEESKGGL